MFIILLDMDETIVGDMSLLSLEFYLIQKLREKENKKGCKRTLALNKTHFSYDIERLIRPGVCEFIHSLAEHAYIFIYTASEDSWAQFVIPYIEKHIGCSFQRPIFTRKSTINEGNSFTKKLSKVQGRIATRITKKGYSKSLVNNCIFIDDKPGNVLDKERVIPATPYHYSEPIDVLRSIPKQIIADNCTTISSVFGFNNSSIKGFYKRYYYFLSKQYKATSTQRSLNQNTHDDKIGSLYFNELTSLLLKYSQSRPSPSVGSASRINTKVVSIITNLQNRNVL